MTQRLNAAIAMYVTGETALIRGGEIDRPALERLAQRAMVINPSAEVCLLVRAGRVMGHALPPESMRTRQVDLRAVRRFLSGDAEMPLYVR